MLKFITYALGAFLLWQGVSALLEVNSPSPTPGEPTAFGDRKRVYLFTGSDWCPACKHLEKAVLTKPEWTQFRSNEISWTVVDVSRSGATAQQENQLRQYRIEGFPTMVVTNPSGKELDRRVGVQGGVEDYKSWIRSAR